MCFVKKYLLEITSPQKDIKARDTFASDTLLYSSNFFFIRSPRYNDKNRSWSERGTFVGLSFTDDFYLRPSGI